MAIVQHNLFRQQHAQDIKLVTKKLRGTAPGFLRYVVIACYLATLCALGGSVTAYMMYRSDMQQMQLYENKKTVILAKIESAKQELARSQGAQAYFKERQDWLTKNYSVMRLYQQVFTAVPARLKVVTLESRDTSNKVDGKSRIEIKVTFQTAGEEQSSVLKFAASLIDARLQIENIKQEVLPSGLLVYAFDVVTFIAQ